MKNLLPRNFTFLSVWAVLVSGWLLSGCQTQALFVPAPQHVHLFKDQGEVQVTGALTSAGISGNIAVAPLPKFEIFAGYNRNNYTKGEEFQQQQMFELGFGFFDNEDDPFITELLFGFSKGNSSFYDTEMTFKDRQFNDSQVDGNFTRVFSQFNCGFTSHILDIGASLRATQIRFPNYSFESFPIHAEFNRYMFLAEPMLFANVGYRSFRLEGIVSYPILISDQTSSRFNGITFSAGIKLMLNRKFGWQDY